VGDLFHRHPTVVVGDLDHDQDDDADQDDHDQHREDFRESHRPLPELPSKSGAVTPLSPYSASSVLIDRSIW